MYRFVSSLQAGTVNVEFVAISGFFFTSILYHFQTRKQKENFSNLSNRVYVPLPVADPGFPVGGAPSHGGMPTSDVGTFQQNICENERIGSRWGEGGACWRCPPLESANGYKLWIKIKYWCLHVSQGYGALLMLFVQGRH